MNTESNSDTVDTKAPFTSEKESSSWVCQLKSDQQPFTVGDRATLDCNTKGIELQAESLVFLSPVPGKDGSVTLAPDYRLVFLELKSQSPENGGKVVLEVTSYIPGQHDFVGFFVSDGQSQVQIANPVPLTVESVLDQQTRQELKDKFWFFSGGTIAIPTWQVLTFWSVLIAVTLGAVIAGLIRSRRHYRKRLRLLGLKKAGPNDVVFFKRLRQIEIDMERAGQDPQTTRAKLDELFSAFLDFVSVQFDILVEDANWSVLNTKLTKRSPGVLFQTRKQFEEIFYLRSSLSELKKVEMRDFKNLTRLMGMLVNRLKTERESL